MTAPNDQDAYHAQLWRMVMDEVHRLDTRGGPGIRMDDDDALPLVLQALRSAVRRAAPPAAPEGERDRTWLASALGHVVWQHGGSADVAAAVSAFVREHALEAPVSESVDFDLMIAALTTYADYEEECGHKDASARAWDLLSRVRGLVVIPTTESEPKP